MRLALVSQDFPPETGGIQSYAFELASQFAKRHRVTVIAPSQRGSRAFDAGRAYETQRYPIGNTSLFGLTTPVSVPYWTKRRRAHVAFHAQYATALGSLAARRFGLLRHYYVAAHAREILRDNLGPLSRVMRRRALMGASGIFAVSRYTAELVRRCGVPQDKVHVVHNGVDLSFFYPRDPEIARERLGLQGKRIALTTGRLIRRKGIDTAIDAFRQLESRYPDLVYIVVGSGPYRRELERQAGALIDTGRIVFTGRVPRDELPEYYSMADIFMMPSREETRRCVEGFGLVFLEANACGTPVIGSSSGGIPDAVEHGTSGLLVPPGDVGALKSAMTRLLDDHSKRRRLGRLGRLRAKRFTWSASAARILQIIEDDIGKDEQR